MKKYKLVNGVTFSVNGERTDDMEMVLKNSDRVEVKY